MTPFMSQVRSLLHTRAATPVSEKTERRLSLRLRNYWEDLRGGTAYPALGDVKPEDISDIWPWCFVISAQGRFPPYDFHYLGGNFATYSSLYLGGERDSIADSTLMDKALERLPEVFEHGAPVYVEEEIPRFDRRRLLMRASLFPLSDDQLHVNFVIGAANGKLVEPKE